MFSVGAEQDVLTKSGGKKYGHHEKVPSFCRLSVNFTGRVRPKAVCQSPMPSKGCSQSQDFTKKFMIITMKDRRTETEKTNRAQRDLRVLRSREEE